MAKIDMTNPAVALDALRSADGNSYDAKLIGKGVKWLRDTGATLDSRIHAMACAVLDRSEMPGVFDASAAAPLLNAMPKSARREALLAWFAAFSNIVLHKEKDGSVTFRGQRKPGAKLHKAVDHADAFAKPFYTAKEAAVSPKAFDDKRFAKLVASLIKTAGDNVASLSPEAQAALADLKLVRQKLPADA